MSALKTRCAMLSEYLKLRIIVPGIYFVLVTSLIVIGLECCVEYSNESTFWYWGVVGILVFPTSLISLFLSLASLHAGESSAVIISLFIGGIVNVILMYYIIRILRPISPDAQKTE